MVPVKLSEPVVSELVKASQKPIVFNELRLFSGCVFSLTHRPPKRQKYALTEFPKREFFLQSIGIASPTAHPTHRKILLLAGVFAGLSVAIEVELPLAMSAGR